MFKLKSVLLLVLTLSVSNNLSGQHFFEINDIKISKATTKIFYSFSFNTKESIELYFKGKTIIESNNEKTIVKSTNYDTKNNKIRSFDVRYLNRFGKDSLTEMFLADKLIMRYKHKYDSLGREIKYSMEDYRNSTIGGFKTKYEYTDSLIKNGRIEIQSKYHVLKSGKKELSSKTYSQFNDRNLIVSLRTRSPDTDTLNLNYYEAFRYDKNDSLISHLVWGREELVKGNRINTPCNLVKSGMLKNTSIETITAQIREILEEKKRHLSSKGCENFFYQLIDLKTQSKLRISQRKPYWCGGRTISFETEIDH